MVKQSIGQPKIIITWEQITDAVKKLSEMIPENSVIYGIPRNGTIISCFLSHQRPDLQVVFENPCDYYAEKEPNSFIVIDDIHDTGNTINVFWPRRMATLFWREKEEDNCPDWFVETIKNDSWLVFPWEK